MTSNMLASPSRFHPPSQKQLVAVRTWSKAYVRILHTNLGPSWDLCCKMLYNVVNQRRRCLCVLHGFCPKKLGTMEQNSRTKPWVSVIRYIYRYIIYTYLYGISWYLYIILQVSTGFFSQKGALIHGVVGIPSDPLLPKFFRQVDAKRPNVPPL